MNATAAADSSEEAATDFHAPSKEELLNNPEIQKLLQKNDKYWEQQMDTTLSKFKKKIEKV